MAATDQTPEKHNPLATQEPSIHGPSKPRQWRKVHLGIDADRLEIRSIEITGSRVGDAPILPELMDQIPADQPIGKVTADGAYDTLGCHAAIAARQRLRRLTCPQERAAMVGEHVRCLGSERNLRTTYRPCRTIWWRWSGSHRRSLIETKMQCFKLLGERVMARDFDRQVAELQFTVVILNRFTALGTPQTQRVG